MVSQEVKAAISEAVSVAMASEAQRMCTKLTELLEEGSRTIDTRMQQASASIEQKLKEMEQASGTVLQYSESLRVQGETLGGEISKLQQHMEISQHKHSPAKQTLQQRWQTLKRHSRTPTLRLNRSRRHIKIYLIYSKVYMARTSRTSSLLLA